MKTEDDIKDYGYQGYGCRIIYYDADYDWERYWKDLDYADGADDAIEDMGW